MDLLLVWIVSGIIFFIIEIFTPTLFFLNLGIACIIVAPVAFYFGATITLVWQIVIWGILSALLLLFLRPFLVKNVSSGAKDSGIDAKYIGHEAKTIKPTGKTDGRITIYGEDWFARSVDGNEIENDVVVKIVRYDNSIFYVERI